MNVVVFAGPTLSREEIAAEIDAVVLPPVAQGDVLAVMRRRPRAIGIIDGYFDRIPAVWHKEILWAMKAGVLVFGAASMGALRAVELAPFGMIGVGKVFQAFHRRDLHDDDEVAVAHAPADQGFRPLSEAMVNIRATLREAEAARVIEASTRARLTAMAKGLDYPERTYARVLAMAAKTDLPAEEMAAFRTWLPGGAVNQKRLDAIDMLRAMSQIVGANPPPLEVDYDFEHTEAWEAACLRDTERARDRGGASRRDLLEEIQVTGDYAAMTGAALARALALRFVPRLGGRADAQATTAAVAELRREHGLLGAEEFRIWLNTMGLGPDDLDRFFRDLADVRRVRSVFEAEIVESLPDCLRERGLYDKVADRAADKRRVLRARYDDTPALSDLGIDEAELWRRYFRDVRGESPPPDLVAYARARGFGGTDDFREAVVRELCFRGASPPVAAPDVSPTNDRA